MTSRKREETIEQNHNKIKSLGFQLENYTKDEDTFFQQLDSSIDKLSAFSDDRDNFTEESWNKLVAQRKELQDKLQAQVTNVRDPRKTKRAYSSLKAIERHWLHVR